VRHEPCFQSSSEPIRRTVGRHRLGQRNSHRSAISRLERGAMDRRSQIGRRSGSAEAVGCSQFDRDSSRNSDNSARSLWGSRPLLMSRLSRLPRLHLVSSPSKGAFRNDARHWRGHEDQPMSEPTKTQVASRWVSGLLGGVRSAFERSGSTVSVVRAGSGRAPALPHKRTIVRHQRCRPTTMPLESGRYLRAHQRKP
jgi:hypothetical protein